MKDCGLAGGIALTLFNQEVAVPALIFAVFTFVYMNWLRFKTRNISGESQTP
jgi:predicted Na+-dependent transporter